MKLSRHARIRRLAAVWVLASHLGGLVPFAYAGPEGGSVAAGQASIDGSVAGLTRITQSTDRAIINWQSFSTAAGETVRFQQPGASSVTLNRVTGPTASQLNGALEANGNVWLLNPNGVVFGRTATVNTGGLLASTLSISDQDFMSGRHQLSQDPGKPLGAVVNKGSIRTSKGGKVALVAPVVSNEGTIEAPGGEVALAAGTKAVVNLDGQGLVNLTVEPGARRAVQMPGDAFGDTLASAVNNKHLVEAGTVSVNGGTVTLGGAEGLAVNAGTIRADADGGHAGRVTVQSAHATGMLAGSVASANGVGAASNGGTVKALSSGIAVFERGARMEAKGGTTGDGGFVELSGQDFVAGGRADLRAPGGKTGTYLIDPAVVTIVNSGGDGVNTINVTDIEDASEFADQMIVATSQIIFANTDSIDLKDQDPSPMDVTGPNLTFEVTGTGSIGIMDDPMTGQNINAGDINQVMDGGGTIEFNVNVEGSIDTSTIAINAQNGSVQMQIGDGEVTGAPTDSIITGPINSSANGFGEIGLFTLGTITLKGKITAPTILSVDLFGLEGITEDVAGVAVSAPSLDLFTNAFARGSTVLAPFETEVGVLDVDSFNPTGVVNIANTGNLTFSADDALSIKVVNTGDLILANRGDGYSVFAEKIHLQTVDQGGPTFSILFNASVDSGISADPDPRRTTYVESSGGIFFNAPGEFIGGDDGTLIAHGGPIGDSMNRLETDFYTLKAVTENGAGGMGNIYINNRSQLDVTQDSQTGVPAFGLDVSTNIGDFSQNEIDIVHDTLGSPRMGLRVANAGAPVGVLSSDGVVGQVRYVNTAATAGINVSTSNALGLDITNGGDLSVIGDLTVTGQNLILKTTAVGADISLSANLNHNVASGITRLEAAQDIVRLSGSINKLGGASTLTLMAGGSVAAAGAGNRLELNAAAGSTLNAVSGLQGSGGGVFVNSTNGLLVNGVNGGMGDVELIVNSATGTIAPGASPNVTGNSVLLQANGGIGVVSGFAPIPVAANAISASASNGNVALQVNGSTTLSSVSAGGLGTDVKVNSNGNVFVQSVSAANVDISTTNGFIRDGDMVDTDVTASSLTLAATAGVGAAGDALETDVTSLIANGGAGVVVAKNVSGSPVTLDAISGGTAAFVSFENPGDIALVRANAPGGSVMLTANGQITDTDADLDIVTGTATLSSTSGIGAGDSIDTDVNVLLVSSTSLGGITIDINEANSLVVANVVTGGNSTFNLTAAGTIVVNNIDVAAPVMLAGEESPLALGGANVNLTAGGAILSSGLGGINIEATGITMMASGNIGTDPGAGGNALITNTDVLMLSSGGSAFIADPNGLIDLIGSASGTLGVLAPLGNLGITSASAGVVRLGAPNGSLIDNNPMAPVVTAGSAELIAGVEIGNQSVPFKTNTGLLSTISAGGVRINEASDVGLVSVLGNGLVDVRTGGNAVLGLVTSATEVRLTVLGNLIDADGPGQNILSPRVYIDAFQIGSRAAPVGIATGDLKAFSSFGLDVNVVDTARVTAVAFDGDANIRSTFGSLIVDVVDGDDVMLEAPLGGVFAGSFTSASGLRAQSASAHITAAGDLFLLANGVAGTRANPLVVDVDGNVGASVLSQDGTGVAVSLSGSVGGSVLALTSTPFAFLENGVSSKVTAGNVVALAQIDADLAVQAYGLFGQLAAIAVGNRDKTLARSLLRFRPGSQNPTPVAQELHQQYGALVVANENASTVQAHAGVDLGPAFRDPLPAPPPSPVVLPVEEPVAAVPPPPTPVLAPIAPPAAFGGSSFGSFGGGAFGGSTFGSAGAVTGAFSAPAVDFGAVAPGAASSSLGAVLSGGPATFGGPATIASLMYGAGFGSPWSSGAFGGGLLGAGLTGGGTLGAGFLGAGLYTGTSVFAFAGAGLPALASGALTGGATGGVASPLSAGLPSGGAFPGLVGAFTASSLTSAFGF